MIVTLSTGRYLYPILLWTDAKTYLYLLIMLAILVLCYTIFFFAAKFKNRYYEKEDDRRDKIKYSYNPLEYGI